MLCTICRHNREGYCAVGREKPQPIKCDSFGRITRNDLQRDLSKGNTRKSK